MIDNLFKRKGSIRGQSILELVLLAICIILAISAPGFFSTRNILNIMRNVAMQGVIAFGMTSSGPRNSCDSSPSLRCSPGHLKTLNRLT
ncbi:MAG: hypothetical protein ACLFPW_04880, partial [Spirochaetaceae bacterium]